MVEKHTIPPTYQSLPPTYQSLPPTYQSLGRDQKEMIHLPTPTFQGGMLVLGRVCIVFFSKPEFFNRILVLGGVSAGNIFPCQPINPNLWSLFTTGLIHPRRFSRRISEPSTVWPWQSTEKTTRNHTAPQCCVLPLVWLRKPPLRQKAPRDGQHWQPPRGHDWHPKRVFIASWKYGS